jgi:uncharacterized protein (TIGR03118 family)
MAIVADPTAIFGNNDRFGFVTDVITTTEDGAIFIWGIDAIGNFPTEGIGVVNHSQQGAVYTSAAILTPSGSAPVLAVANFNSGRIETFNTSFGPLGSFVDPTLPLGFAPFSLQVIGNELFVASALQDGDKRRPVFGDGNGFVSVFSFDGQLTRSFWAGGPLNAPWGITQAGSDFGPFSNSILIANAGDGIVNAFDPATGDPLGRFKDGDDSTIAIPGLHGIIFGSATFGDPNTLYFTAGINNGTDGLLGSITSGLTSQTTVSAPPAQGGLPVTITASVAAGSGNSGEPTGTVTLLDGSMVLGQPTLANGIATLDATLLGVGNHTIHAQYSGDSTFVPSSSQAIVHVDSSPSALSLAAPANAVVGSQVPLRAAVTSPNGTPTGSVVFLENGVALGTAPLNASGIANLSVSTFAVGNHRVTAEYAGDGTFFGSTSAPVTINVSSGDFSFNAAPLSATVTAGQSTQFMLTVTPATGFTDSISFSCSPSSGITCSFSPATVPPSTGAATTTLTIGTSAATQHFGSVFDIGIGPFAGLALFILVALAARGGAKFPRLHPLLTPARALAMAGLALALGVAGCGGGYGGSKTTTPINRGTAMIVVTAQSGAVTHTTTINVTVQ